MTCRTNALLLGSLLLQILIPSYAHACSCVGPIPACQGAWSADAVFVAHVRGNAVRLGPDQLPELYAAVD